jgi:hypothetical protein
MRASLPSFVLRLFEADSSLSLVYLHRFTCIDMLVLFQRQRQGFGKHGLLSGHGVNALDFYWDISLYLL